MTSRAQARKIKKAKNAAFDLAETPKREANGQAQRGSRPERRADRPALEARARRMGRPEKQANDLRAQMLSEDAGVAIWMICDPEPANRLWGHYVALTAAEARYHRSIGKSVHPKCAKIEMMQERFETRDDDQIDIRTEEERDRQAVSTWMRWQGAIGCLLSSEQQAIQSVVRDSVTLIRDAMPTSAAARFVSAMKRLDAMQG